MCEVSFGAARRRRVGKMMGKNVWFIKLIKLIKGGGEYELYERARGIDIVFDLGVEAKLGPLM